METNNTSHKVQHTSRHTHKHVIEYAVGELAKGNIIILCDDNNRENEGDFVQAAAHVTPESVNFLITEGRGLVCQAITGMKAKVLELDLQVVKNTSLYSTAFTVSVDCIYGTTTGISTFDRAKTIVAVENPTTLPTDLARPGHIFPIVAHEGGIMSRRGHTEASITLVNLAKAGETAVICEILDKDGSAAKMPSLEKIAQKYNLAIITVEELVCYVSEMK